MLLYILFPFYTCTYTPRCSTDTNIATDTDTDAGTFGVSTSESRSGIIRVKNTEKQSEGNIRVKNTGSEGNIRVRGKENNTGTKTGSGTEVKLTPLAEDIIIGFSDIFYEGEMVLGQLPHVDGIK